MEAENILLDHGSGGKVSHELIEGLFLSYFNNTILADLDDGAVVTIGEESIAFSTDLYTVDPLFFPGGDIGRLSICGTVNDLSMCGATPRYLSVGFIIEEGFPISDLKRILASIKQSAEEAGVLIVTGDTKVVQRKAADKIFINTSGIGAVAKGVHISGKNACPGDKVLLSGTVADHGITILTHREGLSVESSLKSDVAPLNQMVEEIIAARSHVHTLRDPTRGGIGTTLNEIAKKSGVGIKIYEEAIPMRDEVKGACELLGLDPLYLANEGKLLACVAPQDAERVLEIIHSHRYGRDAQIIGEVFAENPGKVFMETMSGGTRIVDMLTGEQLPRIC